VDPIAGPTGFNIYLVGALPFMLALSVMLYYRRKERRERLATFSCSDKTFRVVVCIAVLVSTGGFWLLEYSKPVETLWDAYYARALNMVAYGVFGYGNEPTAFFPPGYSMLLLPSVVVLGHSKWAIFGTNMTLLLVAVLGFRWCLRSMLLSTHLANILSLFLLLYPTRFFSTYIPLSDIPFSLFALGAFASMLLVIMKKGGTAAVVSAALFGGTAALIRPNGLFLFIPIAIGIVYASSAGTRLQQCAILSGVFLTVLLPWTVRNVNLYGTLVPVSTNGGYNLLAGNNPTRSIYGGYYPDVLLQRSGQPEWNEAQRDDFWLRAGIAEIVHDPPGFALLGVRKIIRTFSSDTHSLGALRVHTNVGQLPGWFLAFLYALNNFLYYVFGLSLLATIWRRWNEYDVVRLIFILTSVIVAGMVFVLFGAPKYKEPLSTIALAVIGVYLSTLPYCRSDHYSKSSFTRSPS